MKRPAFQFYPADWRSNAKLRRCSDAARGAWVDVLCLLHDCDEYGVIRWPLADIARAAGVPLKLLKELADKGVLKGGDNGCEAYIFIPRHGGKDGDPVSLLTAQSSACWYCSRFVKDEYIRHRRGFGSQFSEYNQPPKRQPKQSPKPPFGDGPSSSSSSSIKKEESLTLPFSSERFKEAWEKWRAYRGEIKKKLTSSTISANFRDFQKWGEEQSIKAIDCSIKAGWQGLFEPKPDPQKPGTAAGMGLGRNFTSDQLGI